MPHVTGVVCGRDSKILSFDLTLGSGLLPVAVALDYCSWFCCAGVCLGIIHLLLFPVSYLIVLLLPLPCCNWYSIGVGIYYRLLGTMAYAGSH